MESVQSICICGAGTMGRGIAQVAAQSGFRTILYELNPAVLQQAEKGITEVLTSLVVKGRISEEDKNDTLSRIQFTGDTEHCRADLFIEAIIEKVAVKVDLINQLSENNPRSIFATNTSSLSVKNIAGKCRPRERIVGMHFFNPAPLMKLVEIISTEYTDANVIRQVHEVAARMKKTAVNCKDSPGFIVNRVARPFYIESLRLLEAETASVEVIDRLLESSGFKMGPFKLMDLIGNDINYAVSCSVYEQLGNPQRLKPSAIQENKVKQGKLGKKTGEGYYKYDPQ